jgi:hypothetical protein
MDKVYMNLVFAYFELDYREGVEGSWMSSAELGGEAEEGENKSELGSG